MHKLALRLSCKQLKWEIDNLVGLTIKLFASDASKDSEKLEWVKQIQIRNLTISSGSHKKNLEVYSAWWTSFLKHGGFINLNRLSLSSISMQEKEDLAAILIVFSSLNSLRELSLVLQVFESLDDSIISPPIENYYNFPNLTTLKLECIIVHNIYASQVSTSTYLICFQQMYCPQLKRLNVQLWLDERDTQDLYFLWYLELVEKFSKSLKFLKIRVFAEGDFPNPATAAEKVRKVGSELKNLKELDVALSDANNYRVGADVRQLGWTNLFCGLGTSLEKLKISFYNSKEWELYSQCLKKNSHPNLKLLSLWWNNFHFQLDLNQITQISDRLETLELQVQDEFIGEIEMNFDQIPLSLTKIVLLNSRFREYDLAFLKKLISTKESLIVQYNGSIDIDMAENLGVFLSKPNFIWEGIEYNDLGEWTVACALCDQFDIPHGKLHRSENFR